MDEDITVRHLSIFSCGGPNNSNVAVMVVQHCTQKTVNIPDSDKNQSCLGPNPKSTEVRMAECCRVKKSYLWIFA